MRKMNHILFRPKRLIVLGTLILGTLMPGTLASAQNHTDKREVRRSFPATLETTLEVRNKYGKIQGVHYISSTLSSIFEEWY